MSDTKEDAISFNPNNDSEMPIPIPFLQKSQTF